MVDDMFYLVDVPGYGYASRSQSQRAGFGESIEEYLTSNENLKVVFMLVDSKVGPTNDDMLMYNYLMHLDCNVKIIATKVDKIPSTLRFKAIKNIKEKLKRDDVIVTSAEKNYQIDKVVEVIKEYLG